MRILISGGAGFLGSHLTDLFLGQGHEVVGVDNFITGKEENILHLSGNPKYKFVRQDVIDKRPDDPAAVRAALPGEHAVVGSYLGFLLAENHLDAAALFAQAEAWSGKGVNANAIAPGFFATPLTAAVASDPVKWKANADRTFIGRNGELPDLAGTAIYLASRASDYVTGQTIFVDGGFSAG